VQDQRLSLVLGLDLDPVHGVGHHSVGMRVRIPAVVSDLGTMPDTPNVRLTAVSTEPTLISTVLFAGAGAWTVFCDSQNEHLCAPERQPNPRGGQKDLMLTRYGYELTLNCPRPTTVVCLLDAHRERLRDETART
jgi:hypothetical protein